MCYFQTALPFARVALDMTVRYGTPPLPAKNPLLRPFFVLHHTLYHFAQPARWLACLRAVWNRVLLLLPQLCEQVPFPTTRTRDAGLPWQVAVPQAG